MSERTMNLGAIVDEEMRLVEHLQRASELLKREQDPAALGAAEKEIDAALGLRPHDLRALNLRGLFLFRAGRLEEARLRYLELGRLHPSDLALKLNLGLVELRMGRYAEAATHLKAVVAAEPDNARALGYLGIALARTGELSAARDAPHKSGQPELARQLEARIAQAEEAVTARGDLRQAAVDGAQALAADQPFASVELDAPADEARRGGAWQLRLPGERPPLPGPEGSAPEGLPLLLEPPRPIAAYATTRLLQPDAGEPFAVAEGGMLVVRVDGRLATRTFGVVASTGSLEFEPLTRRLRGQASQDPFGQGEAALFTALGRGLLVISPRGGRFVPLALADDILYVREAALFAFEDSLQWENGRVPGGGEGAGVVHFRGSGRVVLRTPRPVYALKVDPEAPLVIMAPALVGWVGRVVPRVVPGEGGAPSPFVEATGEGVVLIEEPPAA